MSESIPFLGIVTMEKAITLNMKLNANKRESNYRGVKYFTRRYLDTK